MSAIVRVILPRHYLPVFSKRRLLLIALPVFATGAFAWFIFQPGEPSYAGKPLSFWLGQYDGYFNGFGGTNEPEAKRPEVELALSTIGSNATPQLLNMLSARDSALKLKIIELAEKQSVVPIHFVPAQQRRVEALHLFGIVRTNAVGAVPGLTRMLRNDSEPEVRANAAIALSFIGPGAIAAVPQLTASLMDKDFHVKSVAWDALLEVDPATAERIRGEERKPAR